MFVFIAYAATALTLGGVTLAILLDRRARLLELSSLEEQGIRRRSANNENGSA